LKQVFVDADADGSGRLDFEEFKDVIMKIDPEISSTRISHLFRQLVSLETFSPLPYQLQTQCVCISSTRISHLFRQLVSLETFSPLQYQLQTQCVCAWAREDMHPWIRVFVCMNLPGNLSIGPRKQS
jgi:hypothetical protein